MGAIKNCKDLRVWQEGRNIVKNIYEITKKFPNNELYGLVSQLRRASVSVPTNVAEGFARQHQKEYKQFLYVSLSSCVEIETLLILSSDLGYISSVEVQALIDRANVLAKMLHALIGKII